MKKHHQVLAIGAALAVGILTAGTAAADQGPDRSPPHRWSGHQQGLRGRPIVRAAHRQGRQRTRHCRACGSHPGPSNDNFSFAQFLPSANNSISGSTTGATAEVGEPSHGDQLQPAASNSIWYRGRRRPPAA